MSNTWDKTFIFLSSFFSFHRCDILIGASMITIETKVELYIFVCVWPRLCYCHFTNHFENASCPVDCFSSRRKKNLKLFLRWFGVENKFTSRVFHSLSNAIKKSGRKRSLLKVCEIVLSPVIRLLLLLLLLFVNFDISQTGEEEYTKFQGWVEPWLEGNNCTGTAVAAVVFAALRGVNTRSYIWKWKNYLNIRNENLLL